jgi:hypothetical protein
MPKRLIIARIGKVYLNAIANGHSTTPSAKRCLEQNPAQARLDTRRKTMKTMLLAAAAALSLGIGSAHAGDGGPVPNSFFTELPGVIAQAPVQNPAPVATAQNGQAVQAYVTQSNHGTWLFAPNQDQGNNG